MNIPKREKGQGLVEYALLLVLIAVVVIAILAIVGSSVVVVYAKVIGGFNGQTISGSGLEYIVTSHDLSVTQGLGTCSVSISNISAVFFENGNPVDTDTVNLVIQVKGGSSRTLPATTDGNGFVSGLSTSGLSASCPGAISIGSLTVQIP